MEADLFFFFVKSVEKLVTNGDIWPTESLNVECDSRPYEWQQKIKKKKQKINNH